MNERPTAITLHRLYVTEMRTMREIADHYGVVPTTVCKWMRNAEIPARPQHAHFRIRTRDGKQEKICKGPLHKGGVWVRLGDFYKRPDGKPRSHCKTCESYYRGSEPLVDFTENFRGIIYSIVNRLGVEETARRLKISQQTLWQLRRSKRRKIKRKTARKILLLLEELKISHEVRHRDSIHYGAYLRGKPEKKVVTKRDLYRREGDREFANRNRLRDSAKIQLAK